MDQNNSSDINTNHHQFPIASNNDNDDDDDDCKINSILLNENQELWIFGYGSLIWKVDFPIERKINGHITGFLRRFYQHSIDHRGTKDKPGRVCTLMPSNGKDAVVWGVAYKISNDKKLEVLKHLDYREKNGYKRHLVTFYPYSKLLTEKMYESPPSSIETSITIDQQSKEINNNKFTKNNISSTRDDSIKEINNITEDSGVATNIINNVLLYVATEENDSFAGGNDQCELSVIAQQIVNAVGPSGTNREYIYNLGDAMRTLYPNECDDHLFTLENLIRQLDSEKES